MLNLYRPIDNSALIVFRIFFGFLMFFESIGAILLGWVNETFVDVLFTFNFLQFEFLQSLIGPQIYIVYVSMAILGLFIAFGYRYVFAIIGFTILWAFTYFAQKTHYNNHYYLILLISLLLCISPAHRYASLDVKQGRVEESLSCPKWVVRMFMLQVAIVYFYAAVAKLYPDWLAAKPVEIWLSGKSYTSFLWGDGFAERLRLFFSQRWVHLFFAYAGIVFDFFVIPFFMINRWTRWIALISSLIFHLTNSAIFQIGVFPYFALTFVVFYFEVDTIRTRFLKQKPPFVDKNEPSLKSTQRINWVMPALGIYFLIQLLLPLRHFAIPGNVLWDESGHRLSWRMMLRTKYGDTSFFVQAKDLPKKSVRLYDYIRRHQIGDLRAKPDLMWQLAQRIKQDYTNKGYEDVQVFIKSSLSVNNRPRSPFTDENFDVGSEPWHYFDRQPWILDEPEGFIDYYKNYLKPTPKD